MSGVCILAACGVRVLCGVNGGRVLCCCVCVQTNPLRDGCGCCCLIVRAGGLCVRLHALVCSPHARLLKLQSETMDMRVQASVVEQEGLRVPQSSTDASPSAYLQSQAWWVCLQPRSATHPCTHVHAHVRA